MSTSSSDRVYLVRASNSFCSVVKTDGVRSMANRVAHHRAALYRQRARDLVQRAKDIPAVLELAENYIRAANQMAPPPPAISEAQSIFRPPHVR